MRFLWALLLVVLLIVAASCMYTMPPPGSDACTVTACGTVDVVQDSKSCAILLEPLDYMTNYRITATAKTLEQYPATAPATFAYNDSEKRTGPGPE